MEEIYHMQISANRLEIGEKRTVMMMMMTIFSFGKTMQIFWENLLTKLT
jgi:hypothetical protein